MRRRKKPKPLSDKLRSRIERERETLNQFRSEGPCEWCHVWCRRREPAHVIGRGAGGPTIPLNLVALGSTPLRCCLCHTVHHCGGRPTRLDLLDVVAQRTRMEAWKVFEAIYGLIQARTRTPVKETPR